MDWISTLLRLLHIGAAVTWAGSAFFVLAVLDPMAKRIGASETNRLNRHLAARSAMGKFFPIVAILTVLGGIGLYYQVDGMTTYPMSSTPGRVLALGMAAGVLALIWGATMEGRLLTQMGKAAKAIGDKPTAAQESEIAALGHKLSSANKVSGVLILVAVACMATFRYFA